MVASLFGNIGLSVVVNAPIVAGGYYLSDHRDKITGYRHQIGANKGFDTCSFTFLDNKTGVEEWFDYGLGRDIQVFNSGQNIVWHGFVDRVTVNISGLSETRGPLMDMANRVSVTYSPLDSSLTVSGTTTITLIEEDTESQSKYGIIEKVISGGTIDETGAEQIRDTYLNDNKNPQTSGSLDIFKTGGDITVTLDCLGYYHWLGAYVYNDYTTGTEYLSTKIEEVLADDPNNIISTDYSDITSNLFLVSNATINNRYADDVITGLINIGDINDNRYTFGVLEGRKAYYTALPTEYKYTHRLASPTRYVFDDNEGIVNPWDMRAGEWIFISDFLAGRVIEGTDLREDPRMKFIESVSFTAPYSISITGGRFDKASQLMAKTGISGMI